MVVLDLGRFTRNCSKTTRLAARMHLAFWTGGWWALNFSLGGARPHSAVRRVKSIVSSGIQAFNTSAISLGGIIVVQLNELPHERQLQSLL